MHVSLGERGLGAAAPALVVAEIGSNHDGDLERALMLVDAAAHAGADAVQFHSFRAALLLARRWPGPDGGWTAADAYPQLERAELRTEWHARLREQARVRGLVFLSTAFDMQRAELLAALGAPAFPVAAGDLTHVPLLRTLGGFGRPIMLATATAQAEEIAAALVAVGEGAGAPPRRPPVVLVAGPDLRSIGALRARFDCLVGWTDRVPGFTLALGAVALGACVVVKALTDDRCRRGPDHATALEPAELRTMVRAVRELDGALRGTPERRATTPERAGCLARRGVFAVRALPAGAVLEASDLKVVRPALGAPPAALPALVGRRLVRPLAADQPVDLEDVA
ncbi:MAG: N-acetylneuraminate synthase family protein [Candidatus Binatia bacterium]